MTPPAVDGARTPAAVAREAFDAVIARDPEAIVRLGAPDVRDHVVAVGELRGRREVRRFFEEVFSAFPDFTMTVDRIVSDERTAVVQWHATGTFSGRPFLGAVATGRRVALKGVDVMEIDAGMIRRNTIYYDGATMARQVGLLPRRDSIADRTVLAAVNVRTRIARVVERTLGR
ncbi:MAG TPA: ester cyclase, partial [Acidimicrobiales bacterium]